MALALLALSAAAAALTLHLLGAPPAPPGELVLDGSPARLAAAFAAIEVVGLALEEHRAAVGDFPSTLQELVPGQLTELPDDPFAPGTPLRYAAPAPGRLLLWSVGPDGVDQGGRPRDPLTGTGDLVLPVR